MASGSPALLVPEPKAVFAGDARPRGKADPMAAAVKPAKKEPAPSDEWQINPASGVRAVIRAVARYYSVSVSGIVSHRRTHDLIRPRHVAMYLAHELGGYSLAIIGSVLGRDHTTIMHACRRITDLRERQPELDREIRVLISRLEPGTQNE